MLNYKGIILNIKIYGDAMKKNSGLFRFLITGGISTSIDFVIYIILSCRINIISAKITSMLCASIVSYLINKCWTFQNKEKTNWRYLTKFYITFMINVIINISINQIIYIVTESKIIAFIMATGCAMMVNYLLQRIWVFNKN